MSPGDDSKVFVQYEETACVLGRVLQHEDIDFAYYFGDLSSKEKFETVLEFQTNPKYKVMVSGSKGFLGVRQIIASDVDANLFGCRLPPSSAAAWVST